MVDVLAEMTLETPGEQEAAARALKAVIPADPNVVISQESLVRRNIMVVLVKVKTSQTLHPDAFLYTDL